ncbi:hypothetical protein [Streptomyces azureus]|uniref:Putative HTH-type transcriptional regulator n=1 Tax=Streptomyces azureus TaxID=146537 RepID=A0A0K8PKH7_STRAJ|nr:hypothetical protein [Streptomyces azureus]GAP47904.1 putative HTH-type transcriptional regulator [Streptomyces azureus]
MVLHHTPCDHDTEARVVCSSCGEQLRHQDMTARTGPGYPARLLDDPAVRQRFTAGRPLGVARADQA